jgi:hypothetical protein
MRKKDINHVVKSRPRTNPPSLDLDELARQRQKLAQLLGRLLARHWLRQSAADQAHHDGLPDSPASTGRTL